jgi:hypothetical protein
VGLIKGFKEGWDKATIEDTTVPKGLLAQLSARPLPELAAGLFEACFAPDKDGWTKGLTQTDATRHFLEGEGWKGEQDYLAKALVAEAFQLLDHRGLLALYLEDGSSTLHARWCITRAGREAAQAGDVQARLVG